MARRYLFLILCLVFCVGAAVELIAEIRPLPLIRFAVAVERARKLPEASHDLQVRLEREVSAQTGCRHLVARARVTAQVFLMQRSLADQSNPELVATRIRLANVAAREALACNPLDGNLWFLAGWLGRQLDHNDTLFHEFLRASIELAPAEKKTLDGRWVSTARLVAKLGLAQDPLIRADFKTLVEFSDLETAVSVSRALRDSGSSQLVDATLRSLSAERRDKLLALIMAEDPKPDGS